MTRWRSITMRYHTSFVDGGLILAVMAAMTLLAWQVQIFARPGLPMDDQNEIDLDEALLLAGVAMLCLLAFAVRRYLEQRREHALRLDAEHKLRTLAFEDALTGLPNRRRFDEALAAAVAAPPSADACHAVFLLDLNGFKQVNDVHGHAVGDAVLRVVAQRLAGVVKSGDLAARFGGDEFAILAQHLSGPAAATAIAHRVVECLGPPVQTGKLKHAIGTGIGVALMPADADTALELLRKADVALYRAKAARVSGTRFFEPHMDHLVLERAQLIQDMRDALAGGGIAPRFQPVLDLQTGRVVAFEAVPAWQHPQRGELAADQFIPFAEEDGLIHEVAAHLLSLACKAAVGWPGGIGLSLDVFPAQIRDKGLPDRVAAIIAAAGLPPARLELEIAESELVRNLRDARDVVDRLRAMGVRVALDNFGTGYSSLYHLRNLKVDRVKIDRAFVQDLDGPSDNSQILRALIGLGRGLGLNVTANGVGTPGQQAALLRSGCERGQGTSLGSAMSEAEALAYLAATA